MPRLAKDPESFGVGTVVVVINDKSAMVGMCGQIVKVEPDPTLRTVYVRFLKSLGADLPFGFSEVLPLVDLAPGELTEMFGR